jgi:putative phosphonate metabolism protein
MSHRVAFERFAIYWSPEPGTALHALGQQWLGHDPDGKHSASPGFSFALAPDAARKVTAAPRRYGLHATLKAPFRLRPGVQIKDLSRRLEVFAAVRDALSVGPLVLAEIDGFLALCPEEPNPALDQLAHACVLAFDDLRAPLDDDDRARRLAADLSPHQRILLEQWGYPHVLSEFRFHITLTGRLSEEEAQHVREVLEPHLEPICREPIEISSLALLGDPGQGAPFCLLGRFPLAAAA